MRCSTRIMIVFVVLSLVTGALALAQNASEGKTLTVSGTAGLDGVVMIGLPGNRGTDENGRYSAIVEHGWSGVVTPTKEGYAFDPPSRTYDEVTADQVNQDYSPTLITFTISGRTGVSGAEMQGLPGNPVADESGYYSARVDYGWAGTVAPAKEGYSFKPATRVYTKVTSNRTNQNYAARGSPTAGDDELLSEDTSVRGRGRGIYGGLSVTDSRRAREYARYQMAIGPTGGRKVLLVPAAEVKAEDLAEIIEDMHVMAHILDERFKQTRRIQGVFVDFGDFFGRGSRATEATYLEGYGVLFSMEVNFTFSPPPKLQEQETEQTAERVDSTWQRARQQVFSPGDSRRPGQPDSPGEYDSQMVEELKRELIATLKHAANIRILKPDEWVILVLIGGGRELGGVFGGSFPISGGRSTYGTSAPGRAPSGGMGGYGGGYGGAGGYGGGGMGGGMGGMMGGGTGGMMGGGMGAYGGMGYSPATVLTIRAKKSDVDAFGEGELDLEQFRQKVQIFTY